MLLESTPSQRTQAHAAMVGIPPFVIHTVSSQLGTPETSTHSSNSGSHHSCRQFVGANQSPEPATQ